MADSNPSASNRDLLTSGPTPLNPFTFSTGDTKIFITYQGNKIEGLVSSHSLCQASPVWKHFIYPPWTTQGAVGDNIAADATKSIDCTEDDGEALLVLMDIIHLEFQKVPETLPEKTLCQVAFLCEQYQCVRVVAPWVEGWVKVPGWAPNTASWLHIYWTFGYDEEFKELGVEMTDSLFFLKTQGRWMSSETEPVGEPLPPGILESMLQLRLSRIEKLLQIAYEPLTKYEQGAVCTVGRHENPREICDALILGVLIAKLRECGLYPRKQNIDCDHFSVNNLMGMIRYIFAFGLSSGSIPGVDVFIVGDHSDCGVDLGDAIDTFATNHLHPDQDAHREHMRAQRKKLGSIGRIKKRKRSADD